MEIRKSHYLQGAADAVGLTVIIDVFRAYTTAAYILNQNPTALFIVSQAETAYKLKDNYSDIILVGERKGIKLADFNFNNSPYFISRENLTNKIIVLSTSAGTKGIIAAAQADTILTGSFVNISAVAEYIKYKNPATVSIVAMGNNAVTPAAEDELYLKLLNELLTKKIKLPQVEQLKAELRSPAGDRFFNQTTQQEMPAEDFDFCLEIDKFDFIIQADKIKTDIYQLKKIDNYLTQDR